MLTSQLIGKGIYTVPEAARLSRVSPRRIRYWLKGLAKNRPLGENAERFDRRLWHGELPLIGDKLALGFLDLQEIRFVEAFLRMGVSWRFLRAAHDAARNRYGTEHPFCTRHFVTDGSQILEELGSNGAPVAYEEVIQGQRVFPNIISPFLRDLEFGADDHLVRWWPLGKERTVVLDPARCFGQPIICKFGIATEVLESAAKAGQTPEQIAGWYDLDLDCVIDAIEFERGLVA